MTKILIDQEEYELESLPETVRDEFISLHFVQNELNRLEMMTAALKNSERVYADALTEAIGRWKQSKSGNYHHK